MDQKSTCVTRRSPTGPARNGTPSTTAVDVSSTSSLWDDPGFVWRLSTDDLDAIAYWGKTVAPAAHALAHPRPVYDCPGCPSGAEYRDMSAELSWIKAAT